MKSSKRSRSENKGSVRTELSQLAEKAHQLADAAHDLHQRVKHTHDRAHRIQQMDRPPLRKRLPGKEMNWVVPE